MCVLLLRGSTDAVKLAHQCITSLTKDPTQELPQLIRRITGTPPITTAAQKRYVPPSSDPNPTLYPYDELPGAPPATGNATALAYTSVSSPITVTANFGNPARSLQKKSSSSQIVPSSGVTSVAGSNKSKASTTVVTASHEKALIDIKPTSVMNIVPTSRASIIGTTMSAQGLPSGPAPILVRSSSAGSTVQPATSGAVRKLFVTSTQPVKLPPAPRAPFSNSSKTILSRSNSKPILTQDTSTSTAVKSSSTEPILKPTNMFPQQVPMSTASKTMSYSRIIAPQESIRGQLNEVIEQPVQQIMKSPTFFQEGTTQISKPKKISTYSDAVGKKYQSAMASGVSSNTFGNENARMGSTGNVYPPSSIAGGVPSTQSQSTKINLAPGTRPVGSGTVSDNDKVSGD